MDALEVIFSYLSPEQAVVLLTIIGIATFSRNFIERQIGYVFSPQTRLKEQIEDVQKDIQLTTDPEIASYLRYKYEKLVMEYQFELVKPINISKKWLSYSEAKGREDGFTLAALATANLYLGVDETTGTPQIQVSRLHSLLLFFNLVGSLVLLVFASVVITVAIVMIVNGWWTGILIAILAILAWYFAGRFADAVFDFVYVQTTFRKQLSQLLASEKKAEGTKPKMLEADKAISHGEG